MEVSVSDGRVLHSAAFTHGCRQLVLPEENLGEQISRGRRIILPLLPQGFHSPWKL